MKKLLQLLTIPVLSVSMAVTTGSTSAQTAQSCDSASISNTGPGSENKIICSDDTKVVIKCSNGTVINVDLDQDADSGDGTVDGNTNGGGATSGDANNEANLNVDVDNACVLACGACATPETPKPPTPLTPTTAVVTPAQPTKTTSLPSTGDMTPLMEAGLVTGAIVALLAVSRFGVALYRKY